MNSTKSSKRAVEASIEKWHKRSIRTSRRRWTQAFSYKGGTPLLITILFVFSIAIYFVPILGIADQFIDGNCASESVIMQSFKSDFYQKVLLVSIAATTPMTIETTVQIISYFIYGEKAHGLLSKITCANMCTLLDVVLLAYISVKGDADGYWSITLIKELMLLIAMLDYLQCYGGSNWQPYIPHLIAALVGITQVIRKRAAFMLFEFTTVWGIVPTAFLLVAAVVASFQLSKFCSATWTTLREKKRLSEVDYGLLLFPILGALCPTIYFIEFIRFGSIYLCDVDSLYLGTVALGPLAFSICVYILHGRLSRVEVAHTVQALDLKRMFVRYISHEIRTPLNIINSGFVLFEDMRELCLERLKKATDKCDDPELFPMISELFSMGDEMKTSCDIAVNIMNDLLLYEKLEGGIANVDKKPHMIRDIVEETIKAFAIQARENKVDLNCTFDLAGDVYVEADRPKISQVIRNLVSNAIKFSPGGGVGVHVKVVPYKPRRASTWMTTPRLISRSRSSSIDSSRRSSYGVDWDVDVVRIEVRDSGVGISLENQRKLFKGIIQFRPEELQGGGGSGLGLYISKGIMDLHGGRIGVISAGEGGGGGSIFYVEMPVLDRPVAPITDCGRLVKAPSARRNSYIYAAGSFRAVFKMNSHRIYALQDDSPLDELSSPKSIRNTPKTPKVIVSTLSASNLVQLSTTKSLRVTPSGALGGGLGVASTGMIGRDGCIFEEGELSNSASCSAKITLACSQIDTRTSTIGLGESNRDGSYNFSSLMEEPSTRSMAAQSFKGLQPSPFFSSSAPPLNTDPPTPTMDCSSAAPIAVGALTRPLVSFRLSLPSQETASPSLSSYTAKAAASAASDSRSGMTWDSEAFRVLVVDDSATNRKMLIRLLKTKNICKHSMEAADGAEAVAIIQATMGFSTNKYMPPSSSVKRHGSCSLVTDNNDNDEAASDRKAPTLDAAAAARIVSITSGDATISRGHAFGEATAVPVLQPLPDAILMDFVMPVMDGPTATELIRKLGYRKPIIAVTGNALPDDIELFMRKGADAVLTKPVDPQLLSNLLKTKAPSSFK